MTWNLEVCSITVYADCIMPVQVLSAAVRGNLALPLVYIVLRDPLFFVVKLNSQPLALYNNKYFFIIIKVIISSTNIKLLLSNTDFIELSAPS